MFSPTHVVFGVPATGGELDSALALLRSGLTQLRRRACFRDVTAAIGSIELKARDGGWWVHAHVVLDIHEEELEDCADLIEDAFRALTRGRGAFSIDREVEPGTELRIARYVTKVEGWSPPPGALPLRRLEALFYATYGRQLSLAWGAATERKRRPPEPARPTTFP